jgi:hypothetical protein
MPKWPEEMNNITYDNSAHFVRPHFTKGEVVNRRVSSPVLGQKQAENSQAHSTPRTDKPDNE